MFYHDDDERYFDPYEDNTEAERLNLKVVDLEDRSKLICSKKGYQEIMDEIDSLYDYFDEDQDDDEMNDVYTRLICLEHELDSSEKFKRWR